MDSKVESLLLSFLVILFFKKIYSIILFGDVMLIAVDKNSISGYKQDNNRYIYLFDDDEKLNQLPNMHCINYKNCDFVDINLTRFQIDCFKKASITDKDYDKLPSKINYKIAIIVPNCNYAHTLQKCLQSILDQTYKNFEIIFVDDVSEDDSIEIAKQLLKPPHKIIQLKQKRLNGGARNEAYLHLSEDVDYVWYVDSDDWLLDNKVLERINNKLQTKCDVLFVGLSQYKNQQTTTNFIPNYKDKYDAIKGWSGSCGKVIRKNLAIKQQCLYNEGTLKEDRNQHCKICIYMNSFALLKDPVYVWNRENYKSVTTVRNNLWKTSTIRHYADTLQLYLDEKGKDPIIDSYLEQRVKMTKDEIESRHDRQW